MKIYVASNRGTHKGAAFLVDEVAALLDAHLPGWKRFAIIGDDAAVVEGSTTEPVDTAALVAAIEADPRIAPRIARVARDTAGKTALAEAGFVSVEDALATIAAKVADLDAGRCAVLALASDYASPHALPAVKAAVAAAIAAGAESYADIMAGAVQRLGQ